jgi:cysteine desulfurase
MPQTFGGAATGESAVKAALYQQYGSGVTGRRPFLDGGAIYLDYNATTPIDPRVVDAMEPFLGIHFGNPSSAHLFADRSRRALASAREQLAGLIGANAAEVVFTGSGSEANNLAIRGAVLASGVDGAHVITQETEHPAVLETSRALARLHGVRVSYLPVDSQGLLEPATLAAAITPDTVLVSVMHANNETGVIQAISELARIAHEHGALMHTDAAQAVGKVPVDVTGLGVDLLTVVGHKMYAPKGVAALYVRTGVALEPIVYGGGQERGFRAGTENVALAAALGAAADLVRVELAAGGHQQVARLRNRLHDGLARALPNRVRLNGHATQRLPNTLNVSISGVRGDDLLAATPGIAASTGSACHAGSTEPSPVLHAMGLDLDRSLAALRLSLGRWSTEQDVDTAIDILAAAVGAGALTSGHPL